MLMTSKQVRWRAAPLAGGLLRCASRRMPSRHLRSTTRPREAGSVVEADAGRHSPAGCAILVAERRRYAASRSGCPSARDRDLRAPRQELELAARLLDERRAALDPIAIVAVERPSRSTSVGLMNVPANDAVDAGRLRPLAATRCWNVAM